MTITLTPDIEQALTEEAAATGKPPEQLAVERLRTSLAIQTPAKQIPGPTLAELAAMDRTARVMAIMGSSAHLGPSRLWEDREEELAREEQQSS